jgi:hypothetical protein
VIFLAAYIANSYPSAFARLCGDSTRALSRASLMEDFV